MGLGFSGPKKLNESGPLPQMDGAFNGWESTLFLITTTQEMVDGLSVPKTTEARFQGVKQPMSAKNIALKPEGQRAWQWYTVHVKTSQLNLTVDDKIKLGDTIYKVMGRWPWEDANYIEYHIVEDFE